MTCPRLCRFSTNIVVNTIVENQTGVSGCPSFVRENERKMEEHGDVPFLLATSPASLRASTAPGLFFMISNKGDLENASAMSDMSARTGVVVRKVRRWVVLGRIARVDWRRAGVRRIDWRRANMVVGLVVLMWI